jgi:hypothetical protein
MNMGNYNQKKEFSQAGKIVDNSLIIDHLKHYRHPERSEGST